MKPLPTPEHPGLAATVAGLCRAWSQGPFASEIGHRLRLRPERIKLVLQCHKRARAFRILCSVPGMGEVTAMAILVECPEIGTMSRKQVASLAGLAPMTRQSGRWQGKAFIQGGRRFLRAALYMPALVASRHHPDLKRKYQAMVAAGKPPKVALTTLMRKLIELANVLVREDREWAQKGA